MSIGSELTAARERADMTIEQLSAATRIRTGLLIAMEADDFSRCGGNFYARGHIRAIARVVKADPAPLLATFDAEHAAEDEKSRREERVAVKSPTLRPARPRWALVLGAILVVLMGWGMVRLFTLPSDIEANASKTATTSATVTTPTPKPTPQPTVRPTKKPATTPKPPALRTALTMTATGNGTYLTVRDRTDRKIFQGNLTPGIAQSVTSAGDIRVQVANPDNLVVVLNGKRVPTKLTKFTAHPNGTLSKT
ncbi:helix-turn-helix domain-containing protein [Kribbella sp.]|uniref:helix-turn-helix domain-containing protein n=1 Tax=Kribbella sp. TaxID=1871183 RepID=UPI002D4658BC|nr:RodZ domain-containing protein [Kribbella sp.]HZX04624.1 RodZ domain-containing protein [Kribbella sp.]